MSTSEEILRCQLQTHCFSKEKNTEKSYKILENAFSDTLLVSGFQIFIGDHYWSSNWFSNRQHYLSLSQVSKFSRVTLPAIFPACQMVWHNSKRAPARWVKTGFLSETNVSANRRSSKISDYQAIIVVFLLNYAVTVNLDEARGHHSSYWRCDDLRANVSWCKRLCLLSIIVIGVCCLIVYICWWKSSVT